MGQAEKDARKKARIDKRVASGMDRKKVEARVAAREKGGDASDDRRQAERRRDDDRRKVPAKHSPGSERRGKEKDRRSFDKAETAKRELMAKNIKERSEKRGEGKSDKAKERIQERTKKRVVDRTVKRDKATFSKMTAAGKAKHKASLKSFEEREKARTLQKASH